MRRLLSVIGLMLSLVQAAQAQSYPGASLFRYRCEANGITFMTHENDVAYASNTQLAVALSAAASTHQNQPITAGASFSVWALTSNELQVHYPSNIEGTKMVWPVHVCGPVFNAPSDQPEVVAYAQSLGPGQSVAYTRVTGQGTGFAQVMPSGQTTAFAQIAPAASAGTENTASQTHTVQPGENLFRIALRYGTTVQRLMHINHLANAHWITVGQPLLIG